MDVLQIKEKFIGDQECSEETVVWKVIRSKI
jgi:hypothetical protein